MMSLPIRILGTGAALPKQVVCSCTLDTHFGLPPGTIVKRTGVERRHRVGSGESAVTLGALAAQRALEAAGVDATDVDLVLNASGTQPQLIPDGGPLLQQALGLSTRAVPAFSVHATCLSFVVALNTAASLIAAGSYKRVLIISSEVSSVGLHPTEWESAALMGDGAAAVLVGHAESGSGSQLETFRLETYGDAHALAEIPAGGTLAPPGVDGVPSANYRFTMNGPQLLRLAMQISTPFLERLRPGLSKGEGGVDWFVPHQASVAGLRLLNAFRWPADRIVTTLSTLGNCIAASIPLSLHSAVADGRVARGDRVLLVGTGAGTSIGGLAFTY
jgi:3-oxoacyl-[acyl-carrier-protein] synthase III